MYTGEGARESSEMSRARSVDRGQVLRVFLTREIERLPIRRVQFRALIWGDSLPLGRLSSEKDMAIGAVRIPTTFSRSVGVGSTGTWASAKNFLKTSWCLGEVCRSSRMDMEAWVLLSCPNKS